MTNSIWKGALRFNTGRVDVLGNTHLPEFFVIHVTDGDTIAGVDTWFNQPACQASAHSAIGENGEVHDYVHSGDTAWHAGISTTKGAKWDKFKYYNNGVFISPNLYTLGLEHVGRPNKEISEVQYAASAQKIKFWSEKFGIPITRDRFVAHSDIYPLHCCPNLAVNIDKLCALAQNAIAIYPEGYQPPPIA